RLVDVAAAPAGFTILGAGKTAMDACTWLIENGVAPDRIRWVRPRDVWIVDRAAIQPLDLAVRTMETFARWVGTPGRAASLPECDRRREENDALIRLERDYEPSVFRGPILTRAEIAGLRRIENVVRLGRIRHLGADRIVLEKGEIPTSREEIHV